MNSQTNVDSALRRSDIIPMLKAKIGFCDGQIGLEVRDGLITDKNLIKKGETLLMKLTL